MSDALQVWVRNDKGQVYGPLSPPSVELLIDNGIISGRLQVSTNGDNYVFPGRVPGLRMLFPRETWGDTVVPGDELDAEWGKVVMPAALPNQQAAASSPSAVSAAPIAGPGVRAPVAGPGARAPAGGPVAGPGARTQQQQRPMNPAQLSAQQRGAGVVPTAPMKSSPSVAEFMAQPLGSTPSAVARGPVPSTPSAVAPRASSPSVADFMAPPQPTRSSPSAPDFAAAAASRAPERHQPLDGDVFSEAPSPPVAPPRPVVKAAPPPMGESSMPASGTLEQTAPPRLYFLAASAEQTGLLTLKLSDRELVVHFKRGNPEFVDSTHPDDTLDTFLVQQRLVTPAQVQQALADSGRFGGELLPALFGLGLLNPNAAFAQLAQRAATLLMRALLAEQGTFTFDLEELPPARSMPLGNRWQVYADALRKLPFNDLRRRLARAWDLPVMKAGGRLQLADVRLTPQETRALNYFDGVRSLAELARDFPGEAEIIARTAYLLHPLELVSYADVARPTVKTPPQARAAPSAPTRPVSPPKGVAVAPPSIAPPTSAPRAIVPPAIAPPPGGAPRPPSPFPGGAPPTIAPPPGGAPRPPSPFPGGAPPTVAQPPGGAPRPPSPFPGGAPPMVKPPVMASPSRAPVSSPSSPGRPPSSSGSGITAAPDDAKALQALLEKMKKQTYFEVLGVNKDADANMVKIAYLKAARSYHPDTVAPGSPEAVAKAKADLFALIGEANRTLTDAALRADYIAELAAGGTGSKVDVEKLLRAEDSFQKGVIMVKARKYADAVKMLESAIADNADEGEFYAWRGYAKLLAATDRKAVQSDVLKDLNLCVAKNPNVANAYYFLGFLAKLNGDTKTALANFKKCVNLDPKHIDAARELRTMK